MSVRRVARRRAGVSAALRGDLDRLARTVCMVRAGAALVQDEGRDQWWGECENCGRTVWLSWCHVITRGNYHVRWDEDNAFAWCSGCHRSFDVRWQLKAEWVLRRIGARRYEALMMRSRAVGRMDYAAVRVALRARVAGLTKGE